MAALMEYHRRVRRVYPRIDLEVGLSLARKQCTSPERGITLSELRAAYKEHTERDFPVKGNIVVQLNFLLTIPYVASYCNNRGTLYFYLVEPCNYKSEKW